MEQSVEDRDRDLVRAAYENDVALVETLLNSGVDVNARSDSGWTAAMTSAYAGMNETLAMLLRRGADREARDGDGQTALHLAAVGVDRGNLECAQTLIAAGADVNARDSMNGTPLFCAVVTPNMEIARAFLDAGADLEVHDNDGFTALQIAIRADDDGSRIQCAALLASMGADPLPHPTNEMFRVPPPVAAAARKRLADLQPDARVADTEVGPIPPSVVKLIHARAAVLRMEADLMGMQDPFMWAAGGQPDVKEIFCIARRVHLKDELAASLETLRDAKEKVSAELERQQQLVADRIRD